MEVFSMEPQNLPIGVLDSGVGGLTVVKEIQKQLPKENILYFGDSQNMPYGNKSPKEIVALSKKIISFLDNEGVKIILLACNTISSQLNEIVPLTDTPIFDIVYPGCLSAGENILDHTAGLIATEATVRSKIYRETLGGINPEISLVSQGSKDLANFIEKNSTDKDALKKILTDTIDPIIRKASINHLILGCTHYPIVSKDIQELYPNLHLINPATRLVEIAKGYLMEHSLLGASQEPRLKIYTSGPMDNFLPIIDQLEIKNYELIRRTTK